MSAGRGAPVLFAYDGSDEARRAIDTASALLGERPALVLHVYQPFVELLVGDDVALPEPIAADAAETSRMDREDAAARSTSW